MQESETEQILMVLKLAVLEVLDKKHRLEQYAVIWKDRRVMFVVNNDEKRVVMKNTYPGWMVKC